MCNDHGTQDTVCPFIYILSYYERYGSLNHCSLTIDGPLSLLYRGVVMYNFQFGNQWIGKCFVCKKEDDEYNTSRLLCETCVERYNDHSFFVNVLKRLPSFFATILPEVKDIKEEDLHQGFKDILISSGHDRADAEPRRFFKSFFRRKLRLPCGQPSLFEVKSLAEFSGLGGVWTLDLSPYVWSGTLKDLKSWAVLSLAIERNIKHLALWTAGNAGLSLAKLVHRWNATAPEEERKTVYCLVDSSAPPEIVVALRALQCSVAPIATGAGAILSREHLFNVVNSLSDGNAEKDGYWQVTDGWDGMGPFMYSILARQALHFLRNNLEKKNIFKDAEIYIILPIGTGNLLLGFVKGMERVVETGGKRAKIVAAVPWGDHMMVPFLKEKVKSNGGPKIRSQPPEAPKLTGFYSPLSPCLWQLSRDDDFNHVDAVELIEVDLASQVEAAAHVLSPSGLTIAAEPSALLSFGALKDLAQIIKKEGKDPENSVALVVNSGFGIMEIKEQKFYTESIFAFR